MSDPFAREELELAHKKSRIGAARAGGDRHEWTEEIADAR